MGDQLNAERLVTAYRIGRLEDVANELAMKRWLEEIGAEKLHFLLWNEFQARNQKR